MNSSMHLYRSDPSLPGVDLLLDVGELAHVLGIPGPIEIQNIRYKPSTSCLVSYRIGDKQFAHAKAFNRDDWPVRKNKILLAKRDQVKIIDN